MNNAINWNSLEQQVIAWRRTLHQHPELSHQEFHTTRYLQQTLAQFPAITVSAPAPTGLVARLKGAKPGPTVALRADIDALPVQEQNACDYASQNPGIMHACGHDAHAAMLLGAISALTQLRERLAGEVIFIFQRGEEMSPGGAKELVDSGTLDDAQMFFGLHLNPAQSAGTLSVKPGAATANRDTFNIVLRGKGGHSAMPQSAVDPLVASSALVGALQTIVAREVDPGETAVISVCSLICGDGTTARLPDEAHLCGTTRTFSPQIRQQVKQAIARITAAIAAAYRCTEEVRFADWDYSAINNDSALCQRALQAARTALGDARVILAEKPMSVGEDFSEYQRIAPVCFAWLGVAREGLDNPPLHNARFSPDESALIDGVRYYVALIEQLLIQ